MEAAKPKPLKEIPALHLANLTAALAGHQLHRAPLSNSVAVNLAGCRMPIMEARLLWHACLDTLERTPKEERVGLRIENLAMLAASLSHGYAMREIDRRIAAQEALRLWQMCNPNLKTFPKLKGAAAQEMARLEKIKLRRPKKFPISLKAALRKFPWATQMRYVEERESLFKLYLRDCQKPAGDYSPSGPVSAKERDKEEEKCTALGNQEFARLEKHWLTEDEFDSHATWLARWDENRCERLKNEKSSKGGYATKSGAIRAKANLGDSDSQYEIGRMHATGMFEDGAPFEKNYALAAEWLEKSASQGNWSAQRTLAFLCFHGLGVKKDKAKAEALLVKARVGWEAQNLKENAKADEWHSKALASLRGSRDSENKS